MDGFKCGWRNCCHCRRGIIMKKIVIGLLLALFLNVSFAGGLGVPFNQNNVTITGGTISGITSLKLLGSGSLPLKTIQVNSSGSLQFLNNAGGNIGTISDSGVVTLSYLTTTGTVVLTLPPRISTGYTVATLPAGLVGQRAYVTDQLTTCAVAGAVLTGGGTLNCPVFSNGAAWVGD
jgi:hypothetical protein